MPEMDPSMIESLEKILQWAQDQMIRDPGEQRAPEQHMEERPDEGTPEEEAAESPEVEAIEVDEPKRTVLGRHLLGVGAMNTKPRDSKAPVPRKQRY